MCSKVITYAVTYADCVTITPVHYNVNSVINKILTDELANIYNLVQKL